MDWFGKLKEKLPGYFEQAMVLDCGSRDINGTLSPFFESCAYRGLDRVEGKNVDIVGLIHEHSPESLYDVVISASTLEHSEFWQKDLVNMLEMLKPKGLLAVATVRGDFPEHGTVNKPEYGDLTYGTSPDYYRNIEKSDVVGALRPEENFEQFEIEEAPCSDLFFWGIKK